MTSTVNAAISGLLTLLADLEDATVYDGPSTQADDDGDADASDGQTAWVAIGYQPGQTESVTIEYDWAQIGAQRSEERYDILCSLAVSSGDTDAEPGDNSLSTLRTRAFDVRNAVAAAIASDRTLGGAVRLAHISSSTLIQEPTPQGLSVGFAFVVSVQARIAT